MFEIYGNKKNLSVDAKRQAEITVCATNKSQRQDKSAEAIRRYISKNRKLWTSGWNSGKYFQGGYTLCRLWAA